MDKKVAIHVEDMTIAYAEKPVIWDADVDIYENSITAIIGPNGAGKSTLIKGILNIIKPISGEVRIWERPYKEVYRQIAYIPQASNVNWNFPTIVEEVVLMGRYVHVGAFRKYSKEDKKKAQEALETVNMLEFAKRHISELSGGQKQRVFLARAIAQDAKMYFLDEPLQGVDIKTEAIIMDTLKEFQKNSKTIVSVHHDLSTVEEYFDHVVMLNKKILFSGSVAEVFTKENIALTYAS